MNRIILPARGRRFRMFICALLGAGLLLTATACGDDGGGPSFGGGPGGGPSTGGNGGADVTMEVAAFKVCELVDLAPLAKTIHSTGYTFGPKDIEKGVGVDPGGPQCAAQLTMPPLGGTVMIPSRLNAAVVAYGSTAEAGTQYRDRIAQARKLPKDTTSDLAGDWTKGSIVVGEGVGDNKVYALILKDTYLVKIDLQVMSDAGSKAKWPFTLDQVKATVTDAVKKLYAAASDKLAA
jgi:hypothetical protein